LRHRLALRPFRRSLVLPLLAWLVSVSIVAAQQNPFNADGYPAARGTYGSFPYEQVDPLSGNLIVSVTDLSLPGPIPLSVSRSYNSKFHTDFEHGNQAIDEWSPVGVGWRLHFGRVLRADDTTSGKTVIEGTDGGGGALYQTSAYSEGWITKGFVRYNRMTHTARAPNGLTYTFGHIGEASGGPRGQVRYITAIADQFGNTLTFAYAGTPGRVTSVQQVLNANQTRTVGFAYNGNGTLATITYDGRVWTFQYDLAPGASGHFVLRKVIPPAGLSWEHLYTSNGAGPELTALIAPGGGRVDYTYSTVQRRSGSLTPNSRVVTGRALSGRLVTPGSWTFEYDQGANLDTTVVTCACGTTSYRYNGIGIAGNFSAWAMGTLAERRVLNGSTVLEQETLTYAASEPVSSDTIQGEGGQWADGAVYNALITQRTLTRGASTWTTTYAYHSGLSNYNDFGRAYQVTSSGELTRTNTATFEPSISTPSLWLIGGVKSASLTMGATTIQTGSTTYDPSTGLVTASIRMGVPTTFAYNANGTVSSTTNANNHVTQFSYDWGVVSEVRTPMLTTTATVNPDGSNARVTVGNDPIPANNQSTEYIYDPVGRLSIERPRDSNQISYLYDDVQGNTFVQSTRGSSQSSTALDGFGRSVSTWNSSGVRTRIDRDACGRVTYASAPYTTGDGSGRGTTTTYDGLGRMQTVSVTDPAGSATTQYAYTGPDVTITDAINRVTSYDYSSFGGPGDARLMSVLDADGKTTNYQYDMLGNLIQVAGPGSSVQPRTWTYSLTGSFPGRLLQDTQPESGTTVYTYDTLGNVKTVYDSMQRTTTLTYDSNERLTNRQTAGDFTATVTIGYDLLGRVGTKTIPGVVTTYAYDTSGRVTTRTDVIHPSMNFTSRYFYDGNDNLTELRYPCLGSGCTPRSVTYQYDAEGRLIDVLNNGAAFASSFTYDGAGRLATYQTGAVTHRFDYDIRDRVSQLRSGPVAGNALDLTYSYNKVSQVTGIVDYRPGMSQTFGYDLVDRLTSATSIGSYGTIGWTYDAAANRLIATTGANPETFGYNNVGELTADGQGTYTYSPAGMMLTAARPSTGMAASYLYDADNMRVKRAVNDTTLVSVRGAGGQVLSEMQQRCAGNLEWVRDNIYAGEKLLGAVKNNNLPPPATFQFNTTGTSVPEQNGSASVGIKVTMNGISLACAATVSYDTVAGSAVPGVAPSGDYTTTAKTVTFPAGTQNNAVINVTVPISNDAADESDETFTVRLTGVTGGAPGVLSSAPGATAHTVTIQDDDPTPSITVNDITVNETQGTANFTLTLSAPSGKLITVGYATSNGTAIVGSDYLAATGTISIQPGTAQVTIPVTIVNDLLVEVPETFNITLSNPTDVTIADALGVATIDSDELKVPIDPSLPGQYFADVESSANESGSIQTFNPHAIAVSAKLTFVRADGSGFPNVVSVPAQKRVDVNLSTLAIGGTGRASVAVQSLDASRPLVSEYSGYGTAQTFAAGRNDNGATPASNWSFGEGVANAFFDEQLVLFNPTNGPVSVWVTVVRVGQPPSGMTVEMPTGPGRVEFNVGGNFGAVGDHGTIATAVVTGTSTPANIVVQRTMRWNTGATTAESSTSSGASSPSINWFFGDGNKGAWTTYLAFMNPTATASTIWLYYAHDNGQTYYQNVTIDSMRRVTVTPPATMPDGGFALQTYSSNAVPYVVEKSMYSVASWELGSSTTGSPWVYNTWRFAEGSATPFWDTYFLLFNPNSAAANVTMTFRKTDGTTATHTLTVPGTRRVVVNADSLPGINNNATFATEVSVTNGYSIAVERAMYWPDGGWAGSHGSMGRPQ
jgi:YD repeat-containing protein